MSVITISDLDHSNEEQILAELTLWELNTIEGGRRRRRTSSSDVNTSNVLSKQEINDNLNQWLKTIDDHVGDLRQQLS